MIFPWRQLSCALMALAILMAGGNGAMAQQIVAPLRALEMVRDGQITIIDIRRPDEWRRTGVPTGAEQATVSFSRGTARFLKRIAKLTNGDKSKPIALICAAGVRSKHASRLLRNRGYTQVMDISEGMLGNARGVGWLRRDLPVSHCKGCQ
ncbi:MAG: rhodanese-like domain-containing protein [Rhodospirillaceae bacterium]|nr:rhodanese-like domain-containing protein [Rhodospirillaceae bacterium]MBT4690808.1 rhodanese-like domain-containing protein [Rhodospirillaceae bacterium]